MKIVTQLDKNQLTQSTDSLKHEEMHEPEDNPDPEPTSSDSSETSSSDSRAKKSKSKKKKMRHIHRKDDSSNPSSSDDSDSSDASHYRCKQRKNKKHHFSDVSYFFVACVCNHCHWKNQNRRLKMGMTSHLYDAYDAFSSSWFYFSLLLSLMKMSLTNLTMKVLGLGYPPVCAFLHVLNYLLIVLVDCHLIESPYPLVVSVEYIQGSKFSTQKLL